MEEKTSQRRRGPKGRLRHLMSILQVCFVSALLLTVLGWVLLFGRLPHTPRPEDDLDIAVSEDARACGEVGCKACVSLPRCRGCLGEDGICRHAEEELCASSRGRWCGGSFGFPEASSSSPHRGIADGRRNVKRKRARRDYGQGESRGPIPGGEFAWTRDSTVLNFSLCDFGSVRSLGSFTTTGAEAARLMVHLRVSYEGSKNHGRQKDVTLDGKVSRLMQFQPVLIANDGAESPLQQPGLIQRALRDGQPPCAENCREIETTGTTKNTQKTISDAKCKEPVAPEILGINARNSTASLYDALPVGPELLELAAFPGGYWQRKPQVSFLLQNPAHAQGRPLTWTFAVWLIRPCGDVDVDEILNVCTCNRKDHAATPFKSNSSTEAMPPKVCTSPSYFPQFRLELLVFEGADGRTESLEYNMDDTVALLLFCVWLLLRSLAGTPATLALSKVLGLLACDFYMAAYAVSLFLALARKMKEPAKLLGQCTDYAGWCAAAGDVFLFSALVVNEVRGFAVKPLYASSGESKQPASVELSDVKTEPLKLDSFSGGALRTLPGNVSHETAGSRSCWGRRRLLVIVASLLMSVITSLWIAAEGKQVPPGFFLCCEGEGDPRRAPRYPWEPIVIPGVPLPGIQDAVNLLGVTSSYPGLQLWMLVASPVLALLLGTSGPLGFIWPFAAGPFVAWAISRPLARYARRKVMLLVGLILLRTTGAVGLLIGVLFHHGDNERPSVTDGDNDERREELKAPRVTKGLKRLALRRLLLRCSTPGFALAVTATCSWRWYTVNRDIANTLVRPERDAPSSEYEQAKECTASICEMCITETMGFCRVVQRLHNVVESSAVESNLPRKLRDWWWRQGCTRQVLADAECKRAKKPKSELMWTTVVQAGGLARLQQCSEWIYGFEVVPAESWGSLPVELQASWKNESNAKGGAQMRCDQALCGLMAAIFDVVPGETWGCLSNTLVKAWNQLRCEHALCVLMQRATHAVPRMYHEKNWTWGPGERPEHLPESLLPFWEGSWCDEILSRGQILAGSVKYGDPLPEVRGPSAQKCGPQLTPREGSGGPSGGKNASALPKVAVLVAIRNPRLYMNRIDAQPIEWPLFRSFLPSLAQTVDCGFLYHVVLGYDKENPFFNSEGGRETMRDFFDQQVRRRLAARGIDIMLELTRLNESEVGLVRSFNAMAREAQRLGAGYMYRLYDDTRLLMPWARRFVDKLNVWQRYGVVGPTVKELQHTELLVHEFTCVTHMKIFNGNYLPLNILDSCIEDWISQVYDRNHTQKLPDVQVLRPREKKRRCEERTFDKTLAQSRQAVSAWVERTFHG